MSVKPAAPLILAVDDQNDNLRFVGEILDQAGYDVMPALSGAAAVSRASVRHPDLVLLDIAMPGMDGVETCRRLHDLPGLHDLPVIFVTAATDRASLAAAFAAGAVDYITKPFVVDELLARVRVHIDLKQAREKLQTAVRDREEITDVVAHDLKNPLTCVMFAATSQLRSSTDPRTRELAEEVLGCAEEALDYIQRFLTRGAQAQRLRQFLAEPMELADAAHEAIRLQRAAAEHQDIRLSVEGNVTAIGDIRAVRNVIQNLLSNATRRSPKGSEVIVRLSQHAQAPLAVCQVIDQGSGVAESIRERLFERYVRDPAVVPGDYSTGLGLAIARQDIERMGGRLWYENSASGGSVFAFELPQRRDDAPA